MPSARKKQYFARKINNLYSKLQPVENGTPMAYGELSPDGGVRKAALFTTERVNRATVPEGLHAYDMQASEHCAEINEAAQFRIDLIMRSPAKSAGATEDLKRRPLAWAGLMNACGAQADEIVKFELVYD